MFQILDFRYFQVLDQYFITTLFSYLFVDISKTADREKHYWACAVGANQDARKRSHDWPHFGGWTDVPVSDPISVSVGVIHLWGLHIVSCPGSRPRDLCRFIVKLLLFVVVGFILFLFVSPPAFLLLLHEPWISSSGVNTATKSSAGFIVCLQPQRLWRFIQQTWCEHRKQHHNRTHWGHQLHRSDSDSSC